MCGTASGGWTAPGCHEVMEGLYRIPLCMPNDGLRAVNVFALETPNGLSLIDGGWATATADAELRDALAQIGKAPEDITDVFVTHIHMDHYTFGVRLREKYGTRVHLGAGEQAGLIEVNEIVNNVPIESLVQLRRAGDPDLADRIDQMMRPTPFDRDDWQMPDVWLKPGPIDVPGWSLEAVFTPGHTKGHMVFHDRERQVMFTGDHVLPTITPSIGFELGAWDLPLGHYLDSLALLLDRDDAHMMPAHGSPTDSVHARVRELLAHHDTRFSAILAAFSRLGGSGTGAQVADQLLWTRRETPWASLDDFNRMIALCETIAHLDVLVARGQLASTPSEATCFTWRSSRRRPPRASRSYTWTRR
jgi:glyoxylase-like metal-dependent hydrolase (beta-lactamase superfamily II)